ncbi:MAG TPA: tetratricopeptide repeat protein [Patescibacteria group bacterium]|nr:tetratricopeptide repeat protein [Patescibacteria group bacterium]
MKSLVAAIFFLLTISAQAQTTDWAKVHTMTMSAIDHLYNIRFDEAETTCNEIIKMAPGDPRGHFFKAMIHYSKYNYSNNKVDYDRFLQVTYNIEKVCERLLKNNPKDDKAMFYLGGILGYRGLAKFKNEQLMDAVWDGKKAVGLLEDAYKADSTNRDVQFGLGLFNYLISQAPSFAQPALKLAGLGGSKSQGLKQMEYAAKNGIYTQAEARTWLAGFYASEDANTRAYSHLNTLVNQYPQNGWFRVRIGQLLLFSMNRADEAAIHAEKLLISVETAPKEFRPIFKNVANLGLGLRSVFKNNFTDAIPYFQKIVVDNSQQNFVHEANLQLGLIHEISGNRSTAVEYYKKANSSREDVKKLLQKPMSAAEITIVKIESFVRGGYYAQAIAGANEALKTVLNEDSKARLEYIAARAYFEQGNYGEAEQRFLRAVSFKPQEHIWITPFSYYRMGLAQVKAGKKAEAKQNFEKALTFKDFEQEEYLRNEINSELKRIKL